MDHGPELSDAALDHGISNRCLLSKKMFQFRRALCFAFEALPAPTSWRWSVVSSLQKASFSEVVFGWVPPKASQSGYILGRFISNQPHKPPVGSSCLWVNVLEGRKRAPRFLSEIRGETAQSSYRLMRYCSVLNLNILKNYFIETHMYVYKKYIIYICWCVYWNMFVYDWYYFITDSYSWMKHADFLATYMW